MSKEEIEQKVLDALYPITGELDKLPGEMSNVTFSLWVNRPDIRDYLNPRVEKAKEEITKIVDQEVKEVRDKAIQDVLKIAESISFNTEDQAGIKFITVVLEELEEKLKLKSI